MIKTAPSPFRLALLIGFVLATVLTLTYLWISFGGSVPFAAEGYRVQVAFPQANELASGADVRIAGVNVGTVVGLRLDPNDSRTLATLQISNQYAPIPRDTRATLRIKTLLGETYVALSSGNRSAGALPDGGRLPDAQVAPNVTLDQILLTFDPRTRAAWRTWMESQAAAIYGRGEDINAFFGQFPGFINSAERLVTVLNQQSTGVRGLVANTGEFFNAISARQGELSGLILAANNLFQTTARRNQEFAGVFKALPRFERESRLTLPALTAFGNRYDPVVRALQPIAGQLTQTFGYTAQLAPQLHSLFERLGPAVDASKAGLPALDEFLSQLPPLFKAFNPWLRNANPMIRYIGQFKPELTGFFGNVTAATQGYDSQSPNATGQALHYIRAAQTLSPASLAFYPGALGMDRPNAYRVSGAYRQLASGLSVLGGCVASSVNPAPPANAVEPIPTPPGSLSFSQLIQQYVFRNTGGRNVAAPPCRPQGSHVPGFSTAFPQLRADPPPA